MPLLSGFSNCFMMRQRGFAIASRKYNAALKRLLEPILSF
jgi:hypothetical protein